MKYKVQEHDERTREYSVYMVASNGELCKRIATCLDKKDAENLTVLLNEQESIPTFIAQEEVKELAKMIGLVEDHDDALRVAEYLIKEGYRKQPSEVKK